MLTIPSIEQYSCYTATELQPTTTDPFIHVKKIFSIENRTISQHKDR